MPLLWSVLLFIYCSFAVAAQLTGKYSNPADATLPGMFPWAVYMDGESSRFSAVLVTSKYLITSAHGLDQYQDGDCLDAYFAGANQPFTVRVKRFVLSPKFDVSLSQERAYDFAIVELDQALALRQQAITLPIIDDTQYDISELMNISPIYAIGYAGSRIPRLVELMWSWESTHRLYELFYNGTAQPGDSGGPLFYSRNGSYYLLGIHDSSGSTPGNLLSFEPIAKYLDFIVSSTDIGLKHQRPINPLVNWNTVNCTVSGSDSGSAKSYESYVIGAVWAVSIVVTAVVIGGLIYFVKRINAGDGK